MSLGVHVCLKCIHEPVGIELLHVLGYFLKSFRIRTVWRVGVGVKILQQSVNVLIAVSQIFFFFPYFSQNGSAFFDVLVIIVVLSNGLGQDFDGSLFSGLVNYILFDFIFTIQSTNMLEEFYSFKTVLGVDEVARYGIENQRDEVLSNLRLPFWVNVSEENDDFEVK